MTYLLDTNVLIYSVDRRDQFKRDRSREIMRLAVKSRNGVLSSQVLSEFTNVALRKLAFAPDRIFREIERLQLLFPVHPLTAALVLESIRGVKDHMFSFFDAQIWAVAKLNQVPLVVSEDFSDGATVEGVTFVNPFQPSFDVELLH